MCVCIEGLYLSGGCFVFLAHVAQALYACPKADDICHHASDHSYHRDSYALSFVQWIILVLAKGGRDYITH